MTPAVIVDTNVVVAGLLTARDDAPVARILDAMLTASFTFVVSEALLREYHDVLDRPSLRRFHGLSVEQTENILVTLAEHAAVLTPTPTTPAPDPGDQHLWELLAARTDLQLVTGDKRLFQHGPFAHRIVTPETFVASLESGKSHDRG